MVYDFVLWVFWGVVVGSAVSLIFPETKKYILGTVTFGVIGSTFGGILYGLFKIGESIYTHQDLVIFGVFILVSFLLTLLTGLSEKTKV